MNNDEFRYPSLAYYNTISIGSFPLAQTVLTADPKLPLEEKLTDTIAFLTEPRSCLKGKNTLIVKLNENLLIERFHGVPTFIQPFFQFNIY